MVGSVSGNDSPEITVVVVNWNRRELLRDCLDSLERQQGADFELIVVDNGSGDGSPEIGMAASKILVYEDPRRIDKAGHLMYPDGQNRGRGTGELDAGQYDRIEEVLWPAGCAAMDRKAVLDV